MYDEHIWEWLMWLRWGDRPTQRALDEFIGFTEADEIAWNSVL